MPAIWMRLRTELRAHLAATAALILLVGVAGGVVIAAAAGARRTDTAFPRFVKSSRAADVLISPNDLGQKGFYADIERLPQIERSSVGAGVFALHLRPDGRVDPSAALPFASVDRTTMFSVSRPKLIEGHMPDPDRATEAIANRFLAAQYHLHAGSRITYLTFKIPREVADPSQVKPSDGTVVTFTITGIGVFPNDIVPVADLDRAPTLYMTPAYYRKYADPNVLPFDGIFVRLKPGMSVDAIHRDVDRLALKHQKDIGGPLADTPNVPPSQLYFFADEADHNARVQAAIRPQSIALALFALLAAAAFVLAIGQILSRQLFLDASEYPILRGLGMTRRDLFTLATLRVSLIGFAGGVIAIVVAFLASPIFPVGPARLAEPSPGFSANLAVLGIGLIGTLVALLAVTAYPAWRSAGAAAGVLGAAEVRGSQRPSRIARTTARTGATPTVATGVRMALEPGHGRTAVPVRTALVGLIAAIAAVTAAFTYATSLNRLVTTPRLYGWNWDLYLHGFGPIAPTTAIKQAADDPTVDQISGGDYGTVAIAGRLIPAVGVEPIKGALYPTIVEGRPPVGDDEIVLGASSLRTVHAAIGETIPVAIDGKARPMRVVGQAVFPSLGRGSFTPTGLGEGAMVTASNLIPPGTTDEEKFNFVIVRVRPGADPLVFQNRLIEAVARIDPNSDCASPVGCAGSPAERPAELANYARVRATPLILAGLLAVIAAAMIGHALVTSVRRRRHDLAILKTLGFVRRQVSATVAWQATTFAVIALALGLPIGVAVGRWIWTVFADQLGVPPEPVVSLPIVLLAVPAVLLLANAIAAVPGRVASRTQPAAILRTE
jgi:hypothetical protein